MASKQRLQCMPAASSQAAPGIDSTVPAVQDGLDVCLHLPQLLLAPCDVCLHMQSRRQVKREAPQRSMQRPAWRLVRLLAADSYPSQACAHCLLALGSVLL